MNGIISYLRTLKGALLTGGMVVIERTHVAATFRELWYFVLSFSVAQIFNNGLYSCGVCRLRMND